MRWRDGRRSSNVEDYRGRGGGGGLGGGGFKLGLGGLVAIAAAWYFGVDPRLIMGLLDATQGGAPAQIGEPQTSAPNAQAATTGTSIAAGRRSSSAPVPRTAAMKPSEPHTRIGP